MVARLQVLLLRAKNLASKDSNGFSDPFVRLQLGKTKAKSATVYKNLNPVWNEEFLFRVDDVDTDVLSISLWDEDFFGKADFLGQLSIHVADIATAEGQNHPPTWHQLQGNPDKRNYYVSGEVELSFALWGATPKEPKNQPNLFPRASSSGITTNGMPISSVHSDRSDASSEAEPISPLQSDVAGEQGREGHFDDMGGVPRSSTATTQNRRHRPVRTGSAGAFSATKMFSSIRQTVNKSKELVAIPTKECEPVVNAVGSLATGMAKSASLGIQTAAVAAISAFESASSSDAEGAGAAEKGGGAAGGGGGGGDGMPLPASWFEKSLKEIESVGDMSPPYDGGVVLDQAFSCPAHELNAILFRPESEFWQDFAAARKATQMEIGPWIQDAEAGIHRTVTYMTAPSAIVKSVKATEILRYTRMDSGGYILEGEASTPDVPYGNTFRTEMQFCITSLKDGRSHLRVAYRPHFFQNTMMKSMIENGMRSGIKDTYIVFLQVLTKYAVPSGSTAEKPSVGRERMIKSRISDTAVELAEPVSFVIFALTLLLLPWHFSRINNLKGGLSLWLIHLPDSISQLFTAAAIVLAAERVILRFRRFVLSKILAKGDAGKKASGEGWLLTVTLIEGENIGGPGIRELVDPYVVFTCNGKTRTTSVKLQAQCPKWNEILEFDAFEDVPSMMEIELFDYEGPFAEADLLGRSEINFLKQSQQDLADMWVSLEGRRVRLHDSRLHIQVQLSLKSQHKDQVPRVVEQLSKEMKGKMPVTSLEKNVSFQKLFQLPEHEYLINDFSCALKKSILTQGRLFLSPRVLCYYSNIFGKKLRFLILWEDIDEIRTNSPSISSINRFLNPSITIYMKRGKGGADARLGAYGLDSNERLKLRFQSFVRPSVAFRMIELLWKHRALPPEQQLKKVQEAEEKGQGLVRSQSRNMEEEDHASYVGTEPPEILDTTSTEVSITVGQFLLMTQDNNLLQKLADALGQLNLEVSDWVPVEGGRQRNVKYTLSRQLCTFGTNVSVVQLATRDPNPEKPTWAKLEELITLHDVPFGDHFQVEMKRHIKAKSATMSEITLAVAIAWQTETQAATKEKIKRDVASFYKQQQKTMQGVIIREVVCAAH